MSVGWYRRVAVAMLCIVCVETTWIACNPRAIREEEKILTAVNASHEAEMLRLAELLEAVRSHRPIGAANDEP